MSGGNGNGSERQQQRSGNPLKRMKLPQRNQVFESSNTNPHSHSAAENTVSRDVEFNNSRNQRPSPPPNAEDRVGSVTKYKTAAEETVGHLLWSQGLPSQNSDASKYRRKKP